MSEINNPLKRISLRNPTHFFALGFGSGLMPKAPGTWGSLVGLIMGVILLQWISAPFFFILTALLFWWGCFLCQKTSDDMLIHDHGAIVWDEIVAMFLVLLAIPTLSLGWCLTAFILFRVFDILKPYPISHYDAKLSSGFGIMFDDFLAALYTILSIWLLRGIF